MTELESRLTAALAGLLDIPAADVAPATALDQLGVDSFVGLRFGRAIEEMIGAEIDIAWLYDHPTIESLAAFLQARFDIPTLHAV